MVTLCSELALDFHTLNLVFLLDSSSFLYGHLLNIAKQSCFGFQSRNVFRFFLRITHFFLGAVSPLNLITHTMTKIFEC